jgi:hypothetical protein
MKGYRPAEICLVLKLTSKHVPASHRLAGISAALALEATAPVILHMRLATAHATFG